MQDPRPLSKGSELESWPQIQPLITEIYSRSDLFFFAPIWGRIQLPCFQLQFPSFGAQLSLLVSLMCYPPRYTLHLFQLKRVFHAPITYKISHIYALIHSFCTFNSLSTTWRNFHQKGLKHGYEPLKTCQKLACNHMKHIWNIHLSKYTIKF